jgi:hypothetical protein
MQLYNIDVKLLRPQFSGKMAGGACHRANLEFIANTIIFVLAGVIIAGRIWCAATLLPSPGGSIRCCTTVAATG